MRSQRYGACWLSACAPDIVRSVGGCRRSVAGVAPPAPFACRSASLEAVSVQAGPPVLKSATAPAAVRASPELSPRLWRQPALQRRRREALAAPFDAKQPQQRLTAAEHGPAPPGARPHHSRKRPIAARPAGERAARLSGLYRRTAEPSVARTPLKRRRMRAQLAARGAPAMLLPGQRRPLAKAVQTRARQLVAKKGAARPDAQPPQRPRLGPPPTPLRAGLCVQPARSCCAQPRPACVAAQAGE